MALGIAGAVGGHAERAVAERARGGPGEKRGVHAAAVGDDERRERAETAIEGRSARLEPRPIATSIPPRASPGRHVTRPSSCRPCLRCRRPRRRRRRPRIRRRRRPRRSWLLVVVFLVVVLVAFEFERIEIRHAQSAAAGFAIPGIADLHFFEVVVVDLKFGVTFGAGRHTLSLRAEGIVRQLRRSRPIEASDRL